MNKLILIILSISAAFCAAGKPVVNTSAVPLSGGKIPSWEAIRTSARGANQRASEECQYAPRIQPGAERLNLYRHRLKGKRVAVFANHTSAIGKDYIAEMFKKKGVTISVIFGPEHGFQGTADAGAKVGNDELIRQMTGGVPEAEILKSAEPTLGRFKAIRKKYLIYPDFD